MKKAKQWICLLLAVFAVCGAVVGQLAVQQQTVLAQKLVRLHVRANSDSEGDQRIKLLVRDAVLDCVQQMTADCCTSEAALRTISGKLPVLAEAAAGTLRRLGSDASVTVRLCKERFGTRVYPTFSLPAGDYTALRIDIGEAAGHNWWCVVFPTLCTSATTEGMQEAAAAAGFSEGELALIADDTPQVKVKFRVLEWLSSLGSLFSAA